MRTEEAIAAQNAEAEYAPEVEAQRTALESLYREADNLSRAAGTTDGENPDREKVVARILAEVDYEQNRIVDAQRMVEEALAAERGTTPDAAGAKLAAVSSEVDAAQARLDAMEAQLDALTALREQAEDAERDARELVADYTQEAQASEADLAESRKNKEEAETYDAEAKAWALQAADEQKAAERRLLQSEHDLAYFARARKRASNTTHGATRERGISSICRFRTFRARTRARRSSTTASLRATSNPIRDLTAASRA